MLMHDTIKKSITASDNLNIYDLDIDSTVLGVNSSPIYF